MDLTRFPTSFRLPRLNVFLFALLILIWATELLVIQELTTHGKESFSFFGDLKYAARRMLLNIAFCTFLTSLLKRAWLFVASLISTIFSVVVTTYAAYFQQPLSLPVLSLQWREGMAVSDHALSLISWGSVFLLALALGVKVALATFIDRQHQSLSPSVRQSLTIRAGATYAILAIGFAGFYKPLSRVNISTPEYTYGYAVAWTAEFLTYDTDAILADAIAKAATKSHLVTETEGELSFGDHVAVVQVESLDYDAIHAKTAGTLVMPFLHSLQPQAMSYMVKPFHATGSSEADFSFLTTSTPNGKITPFKVVGFPYEDALPRLIEKSGFSAYAFHGNTGAFFHRRTAYEKMGFSRIYFDKELKACGVNGAYDHEVLQLSARTIRESKKPMFHFVITITSHGPFNRLPADYERLIEAPSGIQDRYLNSMRYVDEALERYYDALPENTTFIVYGDHHSNVKGYTTEKVHEDRVPWIICQKGKDLSRRQKSDSTLAHSGELSQLEMACYMRDSLEPNLRIADRIISEQPLVR